MLSRRVWVMVAFSTLMFVLSCGSLLPGGFVQAQDLTDAVCNQYGCPEQEPPVAPEPVAVPVPPYTEPSLDAPTPEVVSSPVPVVEPSQPFEDATDSGNEETALDEEAPPESPEDEDMKPKDYPGFQWRFSNTYYYEEVCVDDCEVQVEHPLYFECIRATNRRFTDTGELSYESSEVVCRHPRYEEWRFGEVPEQWRDRQCVYFYDDEGEQITYVTDRCVIGGPGGRGSNNAADDAGRVDAVPMEHRTNGSRDYENNPIDLHSLLSFIRARVTPDPSTEVLNGNDAITGGVGSAAKASRSPLRDLNFSEVAGQVPHTDEYGSVPARWPVLAREHTSSKRLLISAARSDDIPRTQAANYLTSASQENAKNSVADAYLRASANNRDSTGHSALEQQITGRLMDVTAALLICCILAGGVAVRQRMGRR